MYEECSAPVNWENTLSPELEQQGFVRGLNEPSVYYQPSMDLLALVYVDDTFYDGEEEEIYEAAENLDDRFDWKDLEWVSTDGTPSDYIGMELSMNDQHVWLGMTTYTLQAVERLSFGELIDYNLFKMSQ